MTEGIPEGDEVRRIIINARGEVKNVAPPVSDSQNESETPEKTSGSNTAETAAKIGVGIAAGEIGEALINQVGKTARKILHGGSGERGKSGVSTGGEPPKGPPSGGKTPENKNGDENDSIKNAYFAKVMSMSNDPTLSVKDRVPWVKEKESRIEEFKKFDEGDFVADTRERFQTLMRTSEWDKESGKGVYDRLISYSENRDLEYQGRLESEAKLKGLIGIAIRSEAARVLVAGVENKLRGIANDSDVDSWLNGKNYTDEELDRLSRLAKENHIFDFGTDAPEELVGSGLSKEDESFTGIGMPSATKGNVFERIVDATERTARRLEQEEPEVESLEPEGNESEDWARMVFLNIDRAEKDSDVENKISTDRSKIWSGLALAIDRIPPNLGIKDDFLSEYYSERFPEGVYLKEKLRLYFDARKRLNDRFIEVKTAKGSLSQMGLGSDDIKLKNITPTVQEIEPMDWWILINGDTVLENDLPRMDVNEKKELLPNVDNGLTGWWNTGTQNYKIYKRAINSADSMGKVRRAIAQGVGSQKAEDLAYRIFTTTLTFAMFDKDRSGVQGKSEDRDLIWFDRKRKGDFGAKEREPGVDWTIGRYFATPDQASLVRSEENSKKMQSRREVLQINSERSVFIEPDNFNRGEVVSDFFNSGTVYVPDILSSDDNIARKLISYVIDHNGVAIQGGWRKIPFYFLGQQAYSGYFGYPLSIAGVITKEMGSTTWQKVEEIIPTTFWASKRGLFDRLTAVSPWFNSAEFDFRGKLVREALSNRGFKAEEVDKINGYSGDEDLDVIGDSKKIQAINIIGDLKYRYNNGVTLNLKDEAKRRAREYTENQLHKIRMLYALGVVWPGSLSAIEGTENLLSSSTITSTNVADIVKSLQASRFLEGDYIEQFKYEVWREMGIGPVLGNYKRKRYHNK